MQVYEEFTSTLILIINICFSFYIIVFISGMNKDYDFKRLLSSVFSVSFFLSGLFLVLILYDPSLGKSILSTYIIETLLGGNILVCLLLSKKKQLLKILWTIMLLYPIILIFVLYRFALFRGLIEYKQWITIIFFALILIDIFIISRRLKGYLGYICYGLFTMGISAVFSNYILWDNIHYYNLLFNFISYAFFYFYFYKETYEKLHKEIKEAKVKLKDMDRAIEIQTKKRMISVEKSNKRLIEISKTDKLSGVYNKKTIMEEINKYIDNKRNKKFSILMFDIDNFKGVNDKFGHVMGDKCIRKLGQIARKSINDKGFIGRYGGDEFIILLSTNSMEEAYIVSERLRKNVMKTSAPHFTVSIGIATYPGDGETITKLIEAADKGLYFSKKKGKNSVSHLEHF